MPSQELVSEGVGHISVCTAAEAGACPRQELLLKGAGMTLEDMRHMARWGGRTLSPAVAQAIAAAAVSSKIAELKALRKIKVEVHAAIALPCLV